MKRSPRFSTIELIAQTFHDSWSRLAPTIVLSSLAMVLAFGSTVSSLSEFRSVEDAEAALVMRGSNTFLITSRDRSAFDGAACEALNSVGGISAAGGRTVPTSVRLETLPGFNARSVSVTPGYVRAAWPSLATSSRVVSTVIGSEIAVVTGVGASQYIKLAQSGEGETIRVDAVGKHTDRVEGFNSAIARVVSPHVAVIECLVEALPGRPDSVRSLLNSRFDGTKLITRLYEPDPIGLSPQQRLEARFSLWLPIAAGGVLIVGQLARLLLRRSDFALYRLLGARPIQVACMIMLDYVAYTFMALVAGFLLACGVSGSDWSLLSIQVIGSDFTRLVMCSLIGIPLGTFLLVGKNPLDLIREG